MSRDFEMMAFGNRGGIPLVLFPTSFGRHTQNKDFGLTGEWDNTRHESMRLSHLLNSKGIQHMLDDRRWCGHDWNYWRDMLPYYLSLI